MIAMQAREGITVNDNDEERKVRATRAMLRRQRIAETARKLFVTKGFHGTGVAQIAADSDVKVGQLYRDFSSKEDIVAEIVQRHIGAKLDESGLCKASQERNRAAAREWLQRFLYNDGPDSNCSQDNCAMFAEISAEASRNERIAAIVRATDAHVRAAISTALEVMAPDPALAERRALLAHIIMSIGHGVWYRRIVAPDVSPKLLGDYSLKMIDREIDDLAACASHLQQP